MSINHEVAGGGCPHWLAVSNTSRALLESRVSLGPEVELLRSYCLRVVISSPRGGFSHLVSRLLTALAPTNVCEDAPCEGAEVGPWQQASMNRRFGPMDAAEKE